MRAHIIELVAQALAPMPGPKTLVLFGWGAGRYNRGNSITTPALTNAIAALTAARTSVFSLDITTADWHTLEIGLRRVSEDTGGVYLKTNLFPDTAMDKLVRVISSYYELSIVPPPKLKHPYYLDVRVKRRGARGCAPAKAASMTATTPSSAHGPGDHPNPPSVPPFEKGGS